VITGLAHTAVHVADVEAAVAWYRDALGLRVLSPPYLMDGDAITADMGELLPSPVAVKAAIMGMRDSDHVLEIIEYPHAPCTPAPVDVTRAGYTHLGLICDDIESTRIALDASGARFLTKNIADVAGLRTAWFADPWDNVFILMEKIRRHEQPYFRQY
jgi:catechol 2,3-dioxygenase-like lactoylglutathione lyase family enzyme